VSNRQDKQLETWQGEFGRAYTDRNIQYPFKRFSAFARMLEGLELSRILEVGCNRGHNLVTLTMLLGSDTEIVGIEPNPYALSLARRASDKTSALAGQADDIPFKNEYFDLVFTVGVLIHISLKDLGDCLDEIYRVSRRYILAVEYFAPEETTIPYRGHDNLLWKRDFLAHYQGRFSTLGLVRSGYWGLEHGFDRCNWWLLDKAAAANT
jgi:pseudaminic acid biosynthesis-associated methylase